VLASVWECWVQIVFGWLYKFCFGLQWTAVPPWSPDAMATGQAISCFFVVSLHRIDLDAASGSGFFYILASVPWLTWS
jgi:hypothetical protein